MHSARAGMKLGKQKGKFRNFNTFPSTNSDKGPNTTLEGVEVSATSSIRSQKPSQCGIFVGGSRGRDEKERKMRRLTDANMGLDFRRT